MKNIKFYIIFLVFAHSNLQAQIGKYLVLFKDKNNNSHSISNPLTFVSQRAMDRRVAQGIVFTADDLPPSKIYIDDLKATTGVTVWYQSRWANAALVLMDKSLEASILAKYYVKGFENNGAIDLKSNGQPGARIGEKFDIQLENINHGNATTQTNMLGLQHLHNASFKGEGKIIAVLDDGFNGINQDAYLSSLFLENRIVDKYDFIRNTAEVFDVGGHGNLVLSTMAANTAGSFIGTAPQANYALFRTEYAPDERIIEEVNYLLGCERADSLGADILNSSLGYFDYDYAPYSHVKADLNGDKTLVTRAADWAARAGILVCTSAGNSGALGIGAPADADSVLAIGAVTSAEIVSGFSSVGPSADGRIKPDISAMGSSCTVSRYLSGSTQLLLASGTSFSSPISAGFAACYWQANPSLTNMQVIAAIKNMSTLATSPNNNLGWGIPKFPNLLIAADQDSRTKSIQVNIINSFLTADNQRIIAQIYPVMAGPIPISGEVFVKANIDATTQIVNGKPTLTRHFTITPANNATNVSARVTIFITQAEAELYDANNTGFMDLINPAYPENLMWLKILKKSTLPDNSIVFSEIIPSVPDVIWNPTKNFWEISFFTNGFSEFFVTSYSNNVLPINISNLNVKSTMLGNEISWEADSEIKFSHFEIQRSIDAQIFEKIGEINTRKNSKEINKYEFLDATPNNKSGINYYRLKMVDLDGKFEFSKIISIENTIQHFIKIKNNPIANELVILLSDEIIDNFETIISDISGKIIYQKIHNAEDKVLKINALSWVNSEYILKFNTTGFSETRKFIKQ